MRTTLTEWEDFRKSNIWADLLEEIVERDHLVNNNLRAGNAEWTDDKGKVHRWTDDNMRGRLSELEYLSSLVDFIILDLKMVEESNKENEDAGTESSPSGTSSTN